MFEYLQYYLDLHREKRAAEIVASQEAMHSKLAKMIEDQMALTLTHMETFIDSQVSECTLEVEIKLRSLFITRLRAASIASSRRDPYYQGNGRLGISYVQIKYDMDTITPSVVGPGVTGLVPFHTLQELFEELISYSACRLLNMRQSLSIHDIKQMSKLRRSTQSSFPLKQPFSGAEPMRLLSFLRSILLTILAYIKALQSGSWLISIRREPKSSNEDPDFTDQRKNLSR